jgi:hypothetical protein
MRPAITLSLLVLACQAAGAQAPKEGQPKTLDWSLVPVQGDRDWPDKAHRLVDAYKGRKIVAEGTLGGVTSTGEREITVSLTRPARRGELELVAEVSVTFRDVQQSRVTALVDKRAKVKVSGTATGMGGGFSFTFPLAIDDAQFIVEKKGPNKAEQP